MRGRLIFLGVATSIFLIATWSATATWCVFTGASSLAWHLASQVLTLGFVAATLLGAKYESRAIRCVYRVSAIFLSYLNFALVASVLCWIVWAAACLFHWSIDYRIFASWIFGIAGIITLYGVFNAGRLRVTDFAVKLPNLPDAWNQRVGLLVSDVHLGNIRGRRFVDRLVRQISALNPDIVFVSGDMFDGCRVDLAKVTEPWSRLSVPHGVYFVSGNHDEFLDLRSKLNALERAGMRLLNGESVTIDGVAIAGVNDGESDDPEVLKRHLAHAGVERGVPTILLSHRPRNLSVAEEAGVDLQLSGHTHNGQFWPWTLFITRVHSIYAYGLHQLGAMQVLTTSGAGTWGPPMRVGTRSEIVRITFE